LIAKEKNKGPKKVMTKKKRKRGDTDGKTAAAVAVAVERAERCWCSYWRSTDSTSEESFGEGGDS
jgi:hypothetical protein